MAIINNKFAALVSALTGLSTAEGRVQLDVARTGQELSWREVERAKELVQRALEEVREAITDGSLWESEEVTEVMQRAGLATGELIRQFAHYECEHDEKLFWTPEADGAFCPDCGQKMKRVTRVIKNPQIEKDKETVRKASFAWVSLLMGGATASEEEMAERRAQAENWAFALGAADRSSEDVWTKEVSVLRMRIINARRVEACERFLKFVSEQEAQFSAKAKEAEGPKAPWVFHTCTVCGEETSLELGTIRFCRKDGGLYRQSQWLDSSGRRWRDYEAFLKITADERVSNIAFDMMMDAFLAGLWNDRKESNKALMTFGKLVLKAGTEHVSEEQFLKGMNARMDLLLEGLQEFVQAFHSPVAKIFLALGADSQGPEKMKGDAEKVVSVLKKSMDVMRKGLTVVSTTDVLLRLWVTFFTGAVEGGMIYFAQAGMDEDTALKTVLETIKEQGFPSLSVLKTLRKVCTWGAEGVKGQQKEVKQVIDNSCMICGSRCWSSTYCGCQD